MAGLFLSLLTQDRNLAALNKGPFLMLMDWLSKLQSESELVYKEVVSQ